MKLIKKLRVFSYKFDKGSGPLSLNALQKSIKKGNCRLAIQDYYYLVHKLYLKPEEILLPRAYKITGRFISSFNGDIDSFLANLEQGDIIYAERLRNKKGEMIYKPKEQYKNKDEWILYFHTAIYLGKQNQKITSFLPFDSEYPKNTPLIWHSSVISNGTSLWSWDKFLYYYKPVAAKRIID